MRKSCPDTYISISLASETYKALEQSLEKKSIVKVCRIKLIYEEDTIGGDINSFFSVIFKTKDILDLVHLDLS